MNPLDNPITDEQRRAQQLVIRALGRVIGGPHTLRFPPGRVLEALCAVAGMQAALTLRTVEDLLPIVTEGQRAGEALPDAPRKVPFRRDPARQVEGLVKQLAIAQAQLSLQHRIGTAQGLCATAHLAGQVAALLLIEEADLRTLLQAGIERGTPHAGQAQADIARYYEAKARRRAGQS